METTCTMLTCSAKWSWLKAWAMKIARHRGMKKAIVALARRLAVIMHRMWVDGTEFCGLGKSQWLESRAGSNAIGGDRAPPNGGMMSLAGRWMR